MKKVSTKIKNSIRKEFEMGNSLKELAYKYQVNYGTLRNTASREKWIKGINSGIVYLEAVKEENEKEKEKVKEVISKFKELSSSSIEYLLKLKNSSIYDDKAEMAINYRMKAINESYKLAKDIYSIRNEKEELEYQDKLLRYEEYKKNLLTGDLRTEQLELEIKKKEIEISRLSGNNNTKIETVLDKLENILLEDDDE